MGFDVVGGVAHREGLGGIADADEEFFFIVRIFQVGRFVAIPHADQTNFLAGDIFETSLDVFGEGQTNHRFEQDRQMIGETVAILLRQTLIIIFQSVDRAIVIHPDDNRSAVGVKETDN